MPPLQILRKLLIYKAGTRCFQQTYADKKLHRVAYWDINNKDDVEYMSESSFINIFEFD